MKKSCSECGNNRAAPDVYGARSECGYFKKCFEGWRKSSRMEKKHWVPRKVAMPRNEREE